MTFSGRGFRAGMRDVAPMLLGVVPFGLITGVTSAGVGLTAGEAVAMSVVVYAGASQLAALALIAQGAGFWVIVATAVMINLRMAMYSAAVAPWLQRLRASTRLGLSYLLTDQAFAYSVLRFPREDASFPRRDYYLGVALTMWMGWTIATAVGALLGAQIPPGWQLDFAVPLTFLALLAPAVSDRPSLLAAIVGGGAAIALQGLPFNLGLIVGAILGITAGTASASWWRPAPRRSGAS